jgi:hypothetical protein
MTHAAADLGLALLLFYILPILLAAIRFRLRGETAWQTGDRGSANLLPPAGDPTARIRIYAARTVSWRSVVASHCWIVIKPAGARAYTRYDYTAWGGPIRQNIFAPDARWFGAHPTEIYAADGDSAAAMIQAIEAVIRTYRWSRPGDYRAFPGPNSNTFVQAIIDSVPGLHSTLPPTALGKDFPHDGKWLRHTANGWHLTWRGWLSLRLGWVDGLEVNLLGAVAGLDWRRPALKLPAIGRIEPRMFRRHDICPGRRQAVGT